MLFQEIKRRLFTKYVLFSIIGILIITLGLNFMLIHDENDTSYNLQQEYFYEGDIKEDELLVALKKVRDEKSEESRYISQLYIINSLVNAYPGILYTENKVKDFPDKFAKDFYQCWKYKFEALIKKLPSSQQEIAKEKLNQVKIPFKQYEGHQIYPFVLGNIQIIYMIIAFLVTFFAVSTYSESFEDGSMDIIMTTKFYKKNMFIRVLPVIIYGVLLTIIATLGTVFIISSKFGFKGLKSSFKMISLFSYGNFTIGQTILIMAMAEVIGVFALSTVMGYLSLKLKKTTVVIAIGVGLNMFYIIVSKFMSFSTNLIKYLLNAIPISTHQVFISMNEFSLDFRIWEPYEIMIEVLIVFIISFIALTFSINRKEV
ncbi:hypothetical protein [Clostridium senegalense]|uniref:Uncharacterized protein n=1 Tax=Clostridium senegalense TaxID=1465809 RepID=A0A6M0H456_9CLOT|nr:hypothetical protein [Clostridium senegalense]NEU05317.1 hypothetical protein [Clostridium senegalense]